MNFRARLDRPLYVNACSATSSQVAGDMTLNEVKLRPLTQLQSLQQGDTAQHRAAMSQGALPVGV